MNTEFAKDLSEQCEVTARTLKALAHPERLLVLCHLAEGERSVKDLERLCNTSQSLLSQFLSRMRSEGLVSPSRRGKFVYYRIQDPQLLKLIRALHRIYCP